MWKFIPSDTRVFDDFERQSQHIVTAAALLHALVHDFTDTDTKARALKQVEHEGDQVTHAIVKRLSTTFVAPFDREDIHVLASRLDDILDYIEAAGSALVVYGIKKPTSACRALADIVVAAAQATDNAVRCLRRFDAAFHTAALEVRQQEHRADELLRSSVAALFAEEVGPIEVLKWKEIYELMEGVTDRCEDVANVVEAIILKMT